MRIRSNKNLVSKSGLGQLLGLILGLGILVLSPEAFANDSVESVSKKTRSLGNYQIQLLCAPSLDVSKSQNCKIMITNPNTADTSSVDQSKAMLVLPDTDIFLDVERNTQESGSVFSEKALDKKNNSEEFELQRYKISRDWLFRLKINEDDKEPDISVLSIIVPYEKTN